MGKFYRKLHALVSSAWALAQDRAFQGLCASRHGRHWRACRWALRAARSARMMPSVAERARRSREPSLLSHKPDPGIVKVGASRAIVREATPARPEGPWREGDRGRLRIARAMGPCAGPFAYLAALSLMLFRAGLG